MVQFNTLDEAINAGYVPATAVSGLPDGLSVYEPFTGGKSFGYNFSIGFLESDSAVLYTPVAKAEQVWLKEARNKAGNKGAAKAMFSPEEIAKARAWSADA